MKPRSFRNWLKTADSFDHLARDFIGDARKDRTLPTVKSWTALKSYLHDCGACDGALEGAQITWQDYQDYRACF